MTGVVPMDGAGSGCAVFSLPAGLWRLDSVAWETLSGTPSHSVYFAWGGSTSALDGAGEEQLSDQYPWSAPSWAKSSAGSWAPGALFDATVDTKWRMYAAHEGGGTSSGSLFVVVTVTAIDAFEFSYQVGTADGGEAAA